MSLANCHSRFAELAYTMTSVRSLLGPWPSWKISSITPVSVRGSMRLLQAMELTIPSLSREQSPVTPARLSKLHEAAIRSILVPVKKDCDAEDMVIPVLLMMIFL